MNTNEVKIEYYGWMEPHSSIYDGADMTTLKQQIKTAIPLYMPHCSPTCCCQYHMNDYELFLGIPLFLYWEHSSLAYKSLWPEDPEMKRCGVTGVGYGTWEEVSMCYCRIV